MGQVSPATRLYFALRVLKQMSGSLQKGEVQTTYSLSGKLGIGFDVLEEIMEKLVQANMVRKLAGQGWAVIRDADHVQLAEMYRLFAFDSFQLAVRDEDASIRAWIERIDKHIAEDPAVTLRDLYAGV